VTDGDDDDDDDDNNNNNNNNNNNKPSSGRLKHKAKLDIKQVQVISNMQLQVQDASAIRKYINLKCN
jgi:hypothetical protein